MDNLKFYPLGYSQKMYNRIKTKKVLFALSIVVIVLLLPLLYTSLTDEYVIVASHVPYIILVVIIIFLIILLMTTGKNHESTFEGEIFKKEIAKVTHKSGKVTYNSRLWINDVNNYHVYCDLFVDKKERKAGKQKQYLYYKSGDIIKKIYGLRFPEKLDKSSDESLICVKCGHMNNPNQNKCTKCRFILFK